MNCSQTQSRLEALAFGEPIDSETHAALSTHCIGCPNCQAVASELLLLAAATKTTEFQVPSAWDQRARELANASRTPLRGTLGRVAAALLFLTLGVGLGFWMNPAPNPNPGAAEPKQSIVQRIVYKRDPSESNLTTGNPHTYEPFAYEAGFLSGKTARIVRD